MPKTVTPSAIDLLRIQRRLWKLVCSAHWFELCRAEFVAGRLKERRRPENALDRAGLYPPGGRPRAGRRGTLMRRCITCYSRWQPPYYVGSGGMCEDCSAAIGVPLTDERTHVSTTSSPSAEVFAQLQHYQVRLIETRLLEEDEASLRREIAAHLSGASFATLKKYKKNTDVGKISTKSRDTPAVLMRVDDGEANDLSDTIAAEPPIAANLCDGLA